MTVEENHIGLAVVDEVLRLNPLADPGQVLPVGAGARHRTVHEEGGGGRVGQSGGAKTGEDPLIIAVLC